MVHVLRANPRYGVFSQVKHSRTSSAASYKNDFQELVDTYTRKQKCGEKKSLNSIQELHSAYTLEADNGMSDAESDDSDRDDDLHMKNKKCSRIAKGKEMSVDYLENEVDVFRSVDDWDGIQVRKCFMFLNSTKFFFIIIFICADVAYIVLNILIFHFEVAYGEFFAQAPHVHDIAGDSEIAEPLNEPEERRKLSRAGLELGPTIIYVPTRKETQKISKYLCGCGVKAAAYHAAVRRSLHNI